METKKLAQYSLIYSLASILAQAVTLLKVPVFTRNMSQGQFGEYNLLISVQSLLAIFITMGISSGMTRFINEFEDKNKTKNIALTFLTAWGLLMCLLSFFYSDSLYRLVFPGESGGYYISLLVVNSALLCLIGIYSVYYNMLLKPKLVSAINLAQAVLVLFFSVYLIMIRREGLYGALMAQLYAYALILAGLLLHDLKNIKADFTWCELKVMLKYGLGLLPGSASSWVYTLIDRYFINAMIGLQQVAVYSMGYKIGIMMGTVLISPFLSVFTSFKYKVYNEIDAPEKFRKIYIYYIFTGWFCVIGFSVFAKPAIALLSTSEYSEAFKVVPLVALSYFLYGLGEFYSLGIHIRNKSLLDSLILALGAGSNILLNIELIPPFGIMGAALATVVSYFIMNVLYFLIGRMYLNFGLRYFEPLKGGILAAGLYWVYYATNGLIDNLFLEILLSSLLCLLFLFIGVLSDLLPRDTAMTVFYRIAGKIGLAKSSEKAGL